MSENILKTKRLLLRPFQHRDTEQVYAYLSSPVVMRYFVEGTYSKEQTETFLLEKMDSDFRAVVLKDTGNIIGHLSFHPWFGDHTYEIGWVFREDAQGNGYATEASKALLAHHFSTNPILHRVVATCQPDNIGSWKVMEHLGMRREGTFLSCIPFEEEWWDEHYYAILREEWFQQNP